jgi:hypothetical protein
MHVSSPLSAACPAHPNLLDLISVTTYLVKSRNYKLLQFVVFSILYYQQIGLLCKYLRQCNF